MFFFVIRVRRSIKKKRPVDPTKIELRDRQIDPGWSKNLPQGVMFDQKSSSRASKIDPRGVILEPGEGSEGSGVRLGRPLAPQGGCGRPKSAEKDRFWEDL